MVAQKLEYFPWEPLPHLMNGLLLEGAGDEELARGAAGGGAMALPPSWDRALDEYQAAADAADLPDWQPRWRLGLLQQRMGLFREGNATLAGLLGEFTGLDTAYVKLRTTSRQDVSRGPVLLADA